ncbi:hypothetical protein AGOR_G00031510 [Albula goreensis]|uniref:C1q domain-containing protein n=1 Tax=Albula goreensis TaxID=1534307 RepID=A0A8T3E780_9TELE|nr:hypothetical protein AGOR_G00031510 [Albula goreensis]
MKTVAMCALSLLGALCLCVTVKASTFFVMQEAAVAYGGALPCETWDCKCAFQKTDCCCAANQVTQMEGAMFKHLLQAKTQFIQLQQDVTELTGSQMGTVSFSASMARRNGCFGPFTTSIPIPYNNVTLNKGNGYNPTFGLFTAPLAGLYSFSFTAYSNMGLEGRRLYHSVRLMREGQVVASVWEDNREDVEDSGTQTMLLQLEEGMQVYVELLSGRLLCASNLQYNIFSGYLVY